MTGESDTNCDMLDISSIVEGRTGPSRSAFDDSGSGRSVADQSVVDLSIVRLRTTVVGTDLWQTASQSR